MAASLWKGQYKEGGILFTFVLFDLIYNVIIIHLCVKVGVSFAPPPLSWELPFFYNRKNS